MSDENNNEKYPENIDSDRDIRVLSTGNSKLSGYFFMAAAVVGIAVFAWTQFSDSKVKTVEVPSYKPSEANTTQLPEVQQAIRTAEKTEAQPQIGIDPLEVERMRQQHALELERLKDAQRRLLEAQKSAERRRRSPIVIVNDEAGSAQTARAGNRSAPSNTLDAFYSPNDANEIYNNKSERFLRDAAKADVVDAVAIDLPNQDTLITQGTFISGILETAINSDLPGMIRAVVDKPVYSRTGRLRLIPRGSRLIGRYQSGSQQGQARIFIAWTRLERPDGIVIDLGSMGADELGRSGLGGNVNTHFFQRFGASALLSIIGPTVAILAKNNNVSQNQQLILQSGRNSFNRSAEIALESSINIPPTISVDQGTRINVFVARDLSFYNALKAN
ncbi:Inner membrane protein of type IV secretion of T-DNA complex, TonB-like, VirB10 [hydrothermal vent metagenome]|uniref:Inner membrane protein of type IV secretion of T-DNA complex, TonB-like, VirB10 n=1 Tax=hydrothermal vent metagenome TaxID=652676 RepID=A0A3B0S803_9ZZZZ